MWREVGANEVQKVNKNDESQNLHAMKMWNVDIWKYLKFYIKIQR